MDLPVYSSPPRPKHQLQRSVSEIPSPKASTGHHFPHHHYHLHQHKHLQKREREEKVASSSANKSQINLEGSKSEGVTPNESRSGSRRASLLGLADDTAGMEAPAKRVVKEGEVQREREKTVLRAAELNKSLVALNTLSSNTTRRLDTTYYSILEKLSLLQNTIASLKELAIITRQLNHNFTAESQEVVSDIETQLESFEILATQQSKIEGLEARIQSGRRKVKILGTRVEVVKQRVEDWEKVEYQWQERTRKNIRIIWGIIAAVALVLSGLLIFQNSPARTHGPHLMKGLNASDVLTKSTDVAGPQNETFMLKKAPLHALEALRKPPEDDLEDDPVLRAFDEL